MKRDEILEIQDWAEGYHHKGMAELLTNDIVELCQIALRATDPDMVMVPREPTNRMVEDAGQHLPTSYTLTECYEMFREMYQYMLAAAQEDQP